MSETTDTTRPTSDAELEATFGDEAITEQTRTEADPPEQQQRSTMVPHAALHEERERRKKLETDLQAERDRLARLEERTRLVLEMQQGQPRPAEQPQPPSIDEDPRGFVEGLHKKVEEIEAERRARVDMERQAGQVRQVMTWAQEQERAYKAEAPDYDQAATFLRNSRIEELRELGVPEHQIPQAIHNDLLMIANTARQAGVNPAARIYAVAKRRGYVAQPAESAAERVETVRRGQQLAAAPVGGGSRPDALTAERMLNMSDAEFQTWLSKATDAQKRQAFGS